MPTIYRGKPATGHDTGKHGVIKKVVIGRVKSVLGGRGSPVQGIVWPRGNRGK